MFHVINDPGQLVWLINEHKLSPKLENGENGDRLFGPFWVRRVERYVRYTADGEVWELGIILDASNEDYPRRREEVIQLAEEHRGRMKRGEFVRLLVQAAIDTGLTKRDDILETVEMASNLPAVIESRDTSRSLESIPTEFDAAYVASVLDRGRGGDPTRHFWWVDQGGDYHLH